MDTIEVMLDIFIFFVACPEHFIIKAASSLESQKYFKKMNDHGDSLALEEIISSHIVHSDIECSLECLEEQSCVGYNYRAASKKINCQISRNITLERDTNGEWMFYQDLKTLPAYAAVTSKENDKWTLIARFSNDDSKHWTDDGAFWYDRVAPYGDENNPSTNKDMISAAFWEISGHEIKITRSDDPTHTALLQSTSDCLQGGTFRSKIASYGNFRNGEVWANDQCLGSCPVTYGGQYKTTTGFEQHSCSSDIQNSSYIGFWCDWLDGDGAVIMIGGGGSDCKRADHGIGITAQNKAKFGGGAAHYDFGKNSAVGTQKTYSLNLWVH